MKTLPLIALLSLSSTLAVAEETRQLGSHEHGVGQLNIAFDDAQIALELEAPGADIVGFEYAAQSAQDREAVDAAVAALARPLDLFGFPDAAGCTVVQASAALETEAAHEDHDHAEHKDEEHGEHDHDHAAHKDETHEEAGHTEFHAEYLLNCADVSAASLISFAYFDTFPNAIELEVQVISDKGANAFEVERANPKLDLRDMF